MRSYSSEAFSATRLPARLRMVPPFSSFRTRPSAVTMSMFQVCSPVWRQTGEQTWNIDIVTADGLVLKLEKGGTILSLAGKRVAENASEEYERIYERFDELLRTGRSDVDE